MGITNTGRGLIRDAVSALLTTGGIGLSSSTFSTSDTGLFGGGTTVDALETSTGWTISGDALAPSTNSTAGEYLEGSGCLNLPLTYSSGTGGWQETFSAVNLAAKKLYLWFYIDVVTDLTDTSDCITVELCDSSTFSDSNKYYTSRDSLASGWNSLYVNVDSPDVAASSLATSAITDFKISVKSDQSQSGNNMRIDYLRYYEPGTLGITDSKSSLTKTTGEYYIKTIHSINSTQSYGLTITEAGDSNGSQLISRVTFAALDKGSNTELQIDKYYYIESE